ncbi:MAG TPA: tripartite tricarboxylate transporter substrate-binding protein, partial [Xanthobacteraceae bacterium]|nr:tripartite tricarboxylate transporter substrate-binding protein [Xanthobacteraceae bacterium]
ESGFPDYVVPAWFAALAPANTPKAAVSQLAAWLTAALQAPEIEQKLLIQGLYPSGICGDEFAVHLRDQFDEFGRIIRESNIKAE